MVTRSLGLKILITWFKDSGLQESLTTNSFIFKYLPVGKVAPAGGGGGHNRAECVHSDGMLTQQ